MDCGPAFQMENKSSKNINGPPETQRAIEGSNVMFEHSHLFLSVYLFVQEISIIFLTRGKSQRRSFSFSELVEVLCPSYKSFMLPVFPRSSSVSQSLLLLFCLNKELSSIVGMFVMDAGRIILVRLIFCSLFTGAALTS